MMLTEARSRHRKSPLPYGPSRRGTRTSRTRGAAPCVGPPAGSPPRPNTEHPGTPLALTASRPSSHARQNMANPYQLPGQNSRRMAEKRSPANRYGSLIAGVNRHLLPSHPHTGLPAAPPANRAGTGSRPDSREHAAPSAARPRWCSPCRPWPAADLRRLPEAGRVHAVRTARSRSRGAGRVPYRANRPVRAYGPPLRTWRSPGRRYRPAPGPAATCAPG